MPGIADGGKLKGYIKATSNERCGLFRISHKLRKCGLSGCFGRHAVVKSYRLLQTERSQREACISHSTVLLVPAAVVCKSRSYSSQTCKSVRTRMKPRTCWHTDVARMDTAAMLPTFHVRLDPTQDLQQLPPLCAIVPRSITTAPKQSTDVRRPIRCLLECCTQEQHTTTLA